MKRFKYGLTGLLMAIGLTAALPAVADEVVAYAAGGWFAVDSRAVKDTTLSGGAIIGGETNLVLQCSPSAWGAVSGGSGVTVAYSNATSGAVGTIAAQTADPMLDWTPPAEKGTYELTHQPVDASGNPLGTALIAKFEVEVPVVPILARPEMVDNTTLAVYTNGVLSAETSEESGEWYAWSNEPAVVVYTAKPGYYFDGNGTTVMTNVLDTTKDPATADAPEAPFEAVARSVKTDGGTSVTRYHAAITDAINAIGANGTGTVTMLADVTLVQEGSGTLPDGINLTFDLAGKKIDWTTTNGDALFYFASGSTGKLTIGDSESGGTISSYCASENASDSALILFCDGDGDLTVNGGTFVCSNKVGAATHFFKNGTGDWVFNGGTYKALGEGAGGAHFLYCSAATGTTVIAGGTYDIRATASGAAGIGSNAECFDKITITDGDFDILTTGTWGGAFSCGNGSMVVNGGDFSVTSSATGVYCILAERNGTTILSNGTFRAETTDGYAYAAGSLGAASLTIAGGTYSSKAFKDTAATVVGKEQSTLTLVGSPVINNGATEGTAWNLAVQLFGAHFDFTGYTGENLPSFAVFADGTYGASYVKGDMTKFDGAAIWAGSFSTRPYDWTVQEGRRAFANTDEQTMAAYPWVIDDTVTFTPADIGNTTAVVYTNGAAMAAATSYSLQTNAANVTVVYTAADGYFFEGGVTVVTNALDTAKNPATADAPAAPTKPLTAVEYTAPVYVDGVASNGIAYWTTNSVSTYTVVESSASAVTWGESGATNWFVVKDADVQIDGGVTCQGHVNLILCEGAKLVVTNVPEYLAGIATDPDGSFAVYGQSDGAGMLEVTTKDNGAGIGGKDQEAGRHITIAGGTVKVLSFNRGACIGGGSGADGSDIAIVGGVLYLTSPFYDQGDDISGGGVPDFIGRGYVVRWPEDSYVPPVASNITVLSGVKICFNMTGKYSRDLLKYIEPVAECPEDFDGIIVMTPGTQTISRVLASGLDRWSAASTLALTNAVSGETADIDIGEKVPFAHSFSTLTFQDGTLSLDVSSLSMTIEQQPNATNGYEIVATTDGNDGITNYSWYHAVGGETVGFDTLTNRMMTVEETTYYSEISDTRIKSYPEGPLVLMWQASDLPEGGAFRFNCSAPLLDFYNVMDELFGGAIGQDFCGKLKRKGENEWIYTPNDVEGAYVLPLVCIEGEEITEFCIEDLRYEVTSYEMVDEGATMTAMPVAQGVVGDTYFCSVTYGHNGTPYTADSEDFIYRGIRVGDDAFASIDSGVCTVSGTGDTWDFTKKDNPIDAYWESVRDVVIADGVTGLGSYTFYKFYNVTNMTVGASVTNLATGSIYLCPSLESVSFLGATMPATAVNVLNLKAGIRMDGDTPVVTLVPKVTVGGKEPTLMGTNDLTDKDSWVPVTTGNVKQYHFFRYVVGN